MFKVPSINIGTSTTPIESIKGYTLDDTNVLNNKRQTFLVSNTFENNGFFWCLVSYSVFGQPQYIATTRGIRVLTSGIKSLPVLV